MDYRGDGVDSMNVEDISGLSGFVQKPYQIELLLPQSVLNQQALPLNRFAQMQHREPNAICISIG